MKPGRLRATIAPHRPALCAALAMCAAALLLAGSAQRAASVAEAARESARQARDRLAAGLAHSASEERQRLAAAQQLQALADAGAFADDPEQRRALLRTAQYALRLPGLRYTFGASAPWPGGEAGGPGWIATPLQLELELLHEGDLLALLAHLTAGQLLLVSECRLFRPPGGTRQAPPLLRAECALQWLNIRRADGKPPPGREPLPSPMSAPAIGDPGLGRLLLTPDERRTLDRQRLANPAYLPAAEGGDEPLRFAGELRPGHGRRLRWRDAASGIAAGSELPPLPVGDALMPATGRRQALLGDGRLQIHRPGSSDEAP